MGCSQSRNLRTRPPSRPSATTEQHRRAGPGRTLRQHQQLGRELRPGGAGRSRLQQRPASRAALRCGCATLSDLGNASCVGPLQPALRRSRVRRRAGRRRGRTAVQPGLQLERPGNVAPASLSLHRGYRHASAVAIPGAFAPSVGDTQAHCATYSGSNPTGPPDDPQCTVPVTTQPCYSWAKDFGWMGHLWNWYAERQSGLGCRTARQRPVCRLLP